MAKKNVVKKIFIRAAQEGLWYEVIAIEEGDNPDIEKNAKVVARFEVGFDEASKKFKLRRIKFSDGTPKEAWSVIMGYVREFVDSLNE